MGKDNGNVYEGQGLVLRIYFFKLLQINKETRIANTKKKKYKKIRKVNKHFFKTKSSLSIREIQKKDAFYTYQMCKN